MEKVFQFRVEKKQKLTQQMTISNEYLVILFKNVYSGNLLIIISTHLGAQSSCAKVWLWGIPWSHDPDAILIKLQATKQNDKVEIHNIQHTKSIGSP